MNRDEFEACIQTQYGILPDHPFPEDNVTAVYRHPGNQKWFALVMRVRRDRLIPGADGELDVVNLKIESFLGGAIRQEPGIYPAYHMNKERWISAALDGTAQADQLIALLEMSYALTAPKVRKPGCSRGK